MKKDLKKIKNDLVIYQAKSGAIEFRGDFSRETIWATQAQIAEVFNVDRTVVTKHINNILKNKEIYEKSNVRPDVLRMSREVVLIFSFLLLRKQL